MALKDVPKSPEHRAKLIQVLERTWENRPNKHKIQAIDKVAMTGCCVTCGPVPLKIVRHRNNKQGYVRDQYLCWVGSLRSGEAKVSHAGQALEMLDSQMGLCALCEQPLDRFDMVLDHDHETKLIRGFLHQNCNKGLGMLSDSIDLLKRAIEYLTKK
jgi:hypothetical protein